jgi:hypothetical protein
MNTIKWQQVAIVAVVVVAVTLLSLVYLGSQVSARLGGPCINGDQPRPEQCTGPTAT